MPITKVTTTQLADMVQAETGEGEEFDAAIAKINEWFARGDGLAIYQNAALDSSTVGRRRFFSFGGSDEAQFQGDPPDQLPDFPGEVNWRYRLEAVCDDIAEPLRRAEPRSVCTPIELLQILTDNFRPHNGSKDRLCNYLLRVRRPNPGGPLYVECQLGVDSAEGVVPEWLVTVHCWTDDDGMVNRLGVFAWALRHLATSFKMTGSDPNLGACMVATYNNTLNAPEVS